MPYKKLIETAMPVSVINRESEREKTARNGLPSNVHIWWSRRSMAAARSTLFASLVDDPAGHEELFPTAKDQARERDRLLKLTEELAVVENLSNSELLEAAKKEILRSSPGRLPEVFDPFVGGGTIPVEAHRLGLGAGSSDLNAVAALITTVVSDIPSRFSDAVTVHPRDELTMEIPLPGAQAFAEDLQYYGEQMLGKAAGRVGYLYPKIYDPDSSRELDVSAWIWARTVKCPNPSCNCNIPLSTSYDLARKKGGEAWVEPIAEEGKIRFCIHRKPHQEGKGRPKVAQTAVFKCPVCGEITPDAYVKECGVNHRMNSQLVAIVADTDKKRLYLEANSEHERSADVSKPRELPHGELPNFPRRFAPPSFGLMDYADLFTNRQLVFITTMLDLAKEIQGAVEADAIEKGLADDGIAFSDGGSGAFAYAQAIRIGLVLTISKLLDRCSSLCSWDSSGGGSLRNVFSRAAMPMIWDYAEANPFSLSSGSFLNSLTRTCEAIKNLPSDGIGRTTVSDALEPCDVRNAIISTEIPYYDKAGYADLSDFFFVWLKYGLSDLYPTYFPEATSPKKDELTSFSYRWGGDKGQANAFYEEGLHIALKNLFESASEEYPSTVAFQYKGNNATDKEENTEWEAFITAICRAGFTITASWPIGRKYESSIELAESRGIPITVVICKRPKDAPQTTRRFFVAAVKRELPAIVETMRGVVGMMDLRASVIGQALNIFTRNSKVLDADGTVMKVRVASRIIEQELDTILSSIYPQRSSITTEED